MIVFVRMWEWMCVCISARGLVCLCVGGCTMCVYVWNGVTTKDHTLGRSTDWNQQKQKQQFSFSFVLRGLWTPDKTSSV